MTTTIDDRYLLEERIGSGGMGEVWRGRDLTLNRTVAVKMLHRGLRDDDETRARFEGEARTLAQVHHPNVVDVYDFGTDQGCAYLVMEYVPGRSLGAILREREGEPLEAERTAGILTQAAEALHAVHRAGIVHRDVKPDNLIVQDDGTVVITDFGIARTELSTTLTADGTVIGTAYYMSPEQVSGERPVPASDQYALGVVAFRCLAGRLPFEGETPMDVAVKQLRDPVPDLPAGTPGVLVTAILRSLRKKPADRWSDCQAFAKALAGLIPPGESTASMAAVGGADATVRVSPVRASAAPGAAAPAAGGTGAAVRDRRVPLIAAGVVVALLAVLLAYLIGRPDDTGGGRNGGGGGPEVTEPAGTPDGAGPTDDGSDGADTGADPGTTESRGEDPTTTPTQTAEPDPSEPTGDGDGGDGTEPKQVTVPVVVGETLDEARADIEAAGLTFAVATTDAADPESCAVYQQQPGEGQAEEGDTVTVYVHPDCQEA